MKFIDLQPGDIVTIRPVLVHFGVDGVVHKDTVRERQTILILDKTRIFHGRKTVSWEKTHLIHYLEDGIRKEHTVNDFLAVPRNADVIRDGQIWNNDEV